MPKVSPDYLSARRDDILAAAAVRFARDGFHRTSMQDVIDEAGLSPGAVYRYFRGKEQIIIAIAMEAMGLIEGIVREALDAHRPVPELVRALPAAFLQLSRADDRMRLAVQAWGEALRNPTLAAAMQTGLGGVRGALADRVRLGQSEGAVAADVDPVAVAQVLLAVLQGFIVQRCWDPELDPEMYGRAAAAVVAGALHQSEPPG
jgi:AcrR family transcriptional regulator